MAIMKRYDLSNFAILVLLLFPLAGETFTGDAMNALMKKYRIPGAAVALFSEEELLFLNGFGYADMDTGKQVTGSTIFRTASITKSFTALGFAILAARGKIDLYDPVRELVPEIEIGNPWFDGQPVRVIHLLEHTSGFNELHFNDYNLHDPPDVPLIKGLEIGKNSRNLRWAPGTVRSYSSSGYALAGYIMEKITGDSFELFLEEEILQPLEMKDSSFGLGGDLPDRLARGYGYDYVPSPLTDTYSRSAGALNSTAADLSLFVRFLMKEKETASFLETASTTPASRAGLITGGGRGLGTSAYRGYLWRGHGGADIGFAGAYSYCRELNRGFVILTNCYHPDFAAGMREIQKLLQDYLIETSQNSPEPPPHAGIAAECNYSLLTGFYGWVNPPQRLTAWLDSLLNGYHIYERDGRLYCREYMSDRERRLIPAGSGLFRFEDSPVPSTAFAKGKKTDFFIGDSLYRKKPLWIHLGETGLFLAALAALFAALITGPVMVIISAVRKLRHRPAKKGFTPLIVSFSSSAALITGLILLGSQEMTDWGQPTIENRLFFFLSIWFAAGSVLSLILMIRGKSRNIYGYFLSLSGSGLALFLLSRGIIGL